MDNEYRGEKKSAPEQQKGAALFCEQKNANEISGADGLNANSCVCDEMQKFGNFGQFQNTPDSVADKCDCSQPYYNYPQFTPPATVTKVETNKTLDLIGIISLALAIIGITLFILPWIDIGNLMNKWGLFKQFTTLEQNMSFVVGMFFASFFVFLASAILGVLSLKKNSKSAMCALFISGISIIPSLSFSIIFAFTKTLTDLLI
ncbi:MAG: hypothetical protein ACI4MT_05630 [Christensenellales bacterium]